MRVAKLCDIPFIISILEDAYGVGSLGAIECYLSSKLRFPIDNTYYLNDNNNILFIFERVGLFKCQVHAYSIKGSSNRKETKGFFDLCYEDVHKSHGYTSFLTFVPEGNRVLELTATSVGFKKVGVISRANNTSDETLYTLTRRGD